MAVNTNKTADKLNKRASSMKGEGTDQTVPAQTQEEKKEVQGGMMGLLHQMEPEIRKALPEVMRSDRMIRLALSAWKSDSKLKKSNPMTFVQAVMQASQLGLEPNTNMGESYIIPRWNGRTKETEACFQIGYQGILKLAFRTGLYRSVYAHEVYEGDQFSYKLGLHKDIEHIPADIQEGEPKYFYACYHLTNGGYDFVVWSTKKVKLHASRYAKGLEKDTSPWHRNFVAMARKTVVLDLLKYAPKSIEFNEQLSLDDTVKRDKESEPEKVIIDMDESNEPMNEPINEEWKGSEEDFLNANFQY